VLSALRQAGIAVPEEVAVVGVDGVSLGALAAPPLTTVDLQPGAIGAACVERLLLDGAGGAAGPLVITPRLVVRASAPDPALEAPWATPMTRDDPHG
jgi:DNA-binding LacI/PurR family transcriptional regulator